MCGIQRHTFTHPDLIALLDDAGGKVEVAACTSIYRCSHRHTVLAANET